MTGLWSAALWLLKLAFKIIDAFTTPDLSASGPMGAVLPTTLWLGAALAVIMMFVQLTRGADPPRRESMGRVLLGIGQFGLVWVGYLGLAAGFVAAAAGLEHGILQQMLHVQRPVPRRPERDVPGQDRRHHPGHRPRRARRC